MWSKTVSVVIIATKPKSAIKEAILVTTPASVESDADKPPDILIDADDAESIASVITPKSEPCEVPKESVADSRLVEVKRYCA